MLLHASRQFSGREDTVEDDDDEDDDDKV